MFQYWYTREKEKYVYLHYFVFEALEDLSVVGFKSLFGGSMLLFIYLTMEGMTLSHWRLSKAQNLLDKGIHRIKGTENIPSHFPWVLLSISWHSRGKKWRKEIGKNQQGPEPHQETIAWRQQIFETLKTLRVFPARQIRRWNSKAGILWRANSGKSRYVWKCHRHAKILCQEDIYLLRQSCSRMHSSLPACIDQVYNRALYHCSTVRSWKCHSLKF